MPETKNRRLQIKIRKLLEKQSKIILAITKQQQRNQEMLQKLISQSSIKITSRVDQEAEPSSSSRVLSIPEEHHHPILNNEEIEKALALAAHVLEMTKPIPRPAFADSEYDNPILFLDDFEEYFNRTKLPKGNKLTEILKCFSGYAKMWSTFFQNCWKCYEQFEAEFLKHFWSQRRQIKVRGEILMQRYDSSEESMCEFFIRQANLMKTLTFIEIPEHVMVDDLFRLFPDKILNLWYSLPRSTQTFKSALDFLGQISMAYPPLHEETVKNYENVED